MKYLKYFLSLINHYAAKTVYFIFKGLEKIGIFKETSRQFIASGDLGAVSSLYKQQDYGSAYRTIRKYESMENDYTHGFLKYYLGLAYFHGYGVSENKEKAEIYFIQAGELGNEEAISYINEKSKGAKKH